MRLLSNLHVKGKPTVLPDRAIRRQSHYFIYRPRMLLLSVRSIQLRPPLVSNVGISFSSFIMRRSLVIMNSSSALPLVFVHVLGHNLLLVLCVCVCVSATILPSLDVLMGCVNQLSMYFPPPPKTLSFQRLVISFTLMTCKTTVHWTYSKKMSFGYH